MSGGGAAEAPAGPDFAFGVLGFAVAAFGLALLSVRPTPPAEPNRYGGWSTQRAFAQVGTLAARRHMSGSPAHAEALAWLVAELEGLGLEPELQRAQVQAPEWLEQLPWLEPDEEALEGEADPTPRDEDGRPLIPLTNVLVRVPGRGAQGDRGAVLIQAHYDSTPHTPGAGDNAVGVAALLETLRVILPQAPFRNDLIFHFDDGEELGLLGAELFAAEHPWAEDVRCVLNFDARGNAGPSICFEVGPGSAPLVALFAEHVDQPVGASLAAAVYARMRNDTSFSPQRDRGRPGLNFAYVGGASAYHRPWDTPANLSRATLAHQGGYVHGMVLAAAELDLAELEGAGDAIFFNPLPGLLVHYPLGGPGPVRGWCSRWRPSVCAGPRGPACGSCPPSAAPPCTACWCSSPCASTGR